MNCDQSRQLFSDYLGDEISKPEARELKKHLLLCQGCRQELTLLSNVKSSLRTGWPDEQIPQSLIFDLPKSSSAGFWDRVTGLGLPRGVLVSLTTTACFILCLASLAVFGTQVELKNGSFMISFGQAHPSNTPSPRVSQSVVSTPVSLTSQEVQKLIAQALEQRAQEQSAELHQVLLQAKTEIENNRNADLKRIGQGFEYLEKTQTEVSKEIAMNNSSLNTLVRNFYVRTSSSQ